jgi:hypothetical protein
VREPELFRLELDVVRSVRAQFDNLHLMIPFVRTGGEFEECRRHIEGSGLRPGPRFQLWVMAEVPSVSRIEVSTRVSSIIQKQTRAFTSSKLTIPTQTSWLIPLALLMVYARISVMLF